MYQHEDGLASMCPLWNEEVRARYYNRQLHSPLPYPMSQSPYELPFTPHIPYQEPYFQSPYREHHDPSFLPYNHHSPTPYELSHKPFHSPYQPTFPPYDSYYEPTPLSHDPPFRPSFLSLEPYEEHHLQSNKETSTCEELKMMQEAKQKLYVLLMKLDSKRPMDEQHLDTLEKKIKQRLENEQQLEYLS